MTAFSAPSPPWRSPWSRAYVVFLWVVTWTAGLATRSAFETSGAERREPTCARTYTRRTRNRLSHTRKRVVSGSVAQRAQLLIVDPDVGDHEVEARLPPPDQRDRVFVRNAECGTPTSRQERLRRRREPRSGWRGTNRKGESGPWPVAGTRVRAVTHPAVVTADDQGNPLG